MKRGVRTAEDASQLPLIVSPALRVADRKPNANGGPTASPFVKWVGGKRSVISDLLQAVPKSFNTYWEPFVGGGALFYALRSSLKSAVLSDLNLDLVLAYKVIQQDPESLIKELRTFSRSHEESFYYEVRSQHEQGDAVRIAARLIYLNRTCYNGLWRVNSRGHFNVPMGRYENPDIVQEQNIWACHRILKGIQIEYGGFQRISPRRGDFVYFDPPYHPTDSSAFTEYEKSGFTEHNQQALHDFALELHKSGVFVMLSNSDTEFIRGLYSERQFRVATIQAPRAVNCKPNKRSAVNELLIRTYDA